MNVLIGGDSYGVPSEYVNDVMAKLEKPSHIYHFFQQDNHNVYSMALCGAEPTTTIRRLAKWLSGGVPDHIYHTHYGNPPKLINPNIKYDLLIYFQPPLMRDFLNFNKEMVLRKAMLQHSHVIYKNLARLIERYQIPKLALIGGIARVMDTYKNYLTPDLFIENWVQNIIGMPEPFYSQTMGGLPTYDQLKECGASPEYIDEILRNDEWLKGVLTEYNNFPDDAHPGATEHANLYSKLKLIFNL